MTLDPERSEQVRELFARAVELPARERGAFLADNCADDNALRAEVESLLAHEPGPASDPGMITGGMAAQVLQFAPGTPIGPFTVQRLIGAGASGDVYLAAQKSPQREVALKILRTGADRGSFERFKLEGEALARLNHDNVAKVYQVGTAPGGRPYIAMELVQGRTITTHADVSRLSLRDRLTLFSTLCDALEHIHQNGFIHRDLKPDNVIVPEGASRRSPKVLDFGIAKATAGPATGGGLPGGTVDGAMLGTLEYASPEQLVDSRGVDLRSDLYSAGVILHELLTGTRPFRVTTSGFAGFLDALRKQDALPPSQLLARDPEALTRIATAMQLAPVQLLRALREDLDWIVLKALSKSPANRYGTADALRADIRRHLSGLPVSAHPPTRWYTVRKFVARHRVGVAAAFAITLAVTGGFAATALQYTLAQGRLQDLERLSTDLISSVNEIQDIPGAMLAKERLVASAAHTLDRIGRRNLDLAGQARLADAFERIGQLRADPYTASLGQTNAGVSDLCRAFELRRSIHATRPDMATATNLIHTGFLLALVLQSGYPPPPDSDSLLNAVIAIGEPLAARPDATATLIRELCFAMDLEAEYQYVDGHWQRTLERIRGAYALRTQQAALHPDSEDAARDVGESLGRLAYATSSPDSAREFSARALAIQERYFSNHPFSYRAHLDLTFALRNAAYALQRAGLADRALPLYQRCVALRRTMASSDTIDARSLHQLANALDWLSAGWTAAGRPDSALTSATEAAGIRVELLARAPVWAGAGQVQSQLTLARAQLRAGHFATAETLYDAVCANTSVWVALDGIRLWRYHVERAHTRMRAGRFAQADSELAASAHILANVEARLRAYGADATPFADLALAYLHLAQVRRAHPAGCLAYLESAARLPGIAADSREALALVENEWACALAAGGERTQAMAKFRDALAHCRRPTLRAIIVRNSALCAEGSPAPATSGSVATSAGSSRPSAGASRYDAAADPYHDLDLVVFRMIPMWAEHPEPPARRLTRADLADLREVPAHPRQPQSGVIADRPR